MKKIIANSEHSELLVSKSTTDLTRLVKDPVKFESFLGTIIEDGEELPDPQAEFVIKLNKAKRFGENKDANAYISALILVIFQYNNNKEGNFEGKEPELERLTAQKRSLPEKIQEAKTILKRPLPTHEKA